MAFDIMRLFDDEAFISPGSIGGKIKKYRELRGWSQKELGIRCGFSPSTADVRIAQYEKNKKIPREKALKDIAAALGVDKYALFDADMLPHNRMYHALFDMEGFHGLHPVKKKAMEKGLPVERFSPEEMTEIDYDYIHLFSIKSEEITKDDDSKRLYARLVCAIETMQQNRINIIKGITSKDKELFVTYKYPSSQYRYFETLEHSWEDISYILERQPWWSKEELDNLEAKFRAKVTGENDVEFTDEEKN